MECIFSSFGTGLSKTIVIANTYNRIQCKQAFKRIVYTKNNVLSQYSNYVYNAFQRNVLKQHNDNTSRFV